MFELVLEFNRLTQRFDGAVSKTIRDVVLTENNPKLEGLVFEYLKHLNDTVKMFDDIFKDITFDEFENDLYSLYLDKLYETINFYFVMCHCGNFYKKYSARYWTETQKHILRIWKDSSFDENKKEDIFIKIFSDLFDNVINTIPDICVRRLEDFNNLYRASTYMVDDAYNYIMPDPEYCKDNRWNDDKVAFLYMAYDNEGESYENITLAEKTCFEECRLGDDKEVAICQFKPINKTGKILYLSYQDIDYDKLFMELDDSAKPDSHLVLDAVTRNEKIKNKLIRYAQNGNKNMFNRTIDQFMKKMGLQADLKKLVQKKMAIMMMGNICDAIFYAVDKEKDPKLEAYVPFRKFSKYLISKGFAGVAFRSTRMQLIGLSGTNITLFNPNDAEYISGTMKKYRYHRDSECELLKSY